MAGITINSNVSSLSTQRALSNASNDLSRSYQRLSSGLRISRASDDAAGLAVSSLLDADARVMGQGERNVSDGQSALAIADGALTELSNITIRQQELAEQSANGAYSAMQRLALNKEANALTDEYNRIVSAAEFNNISLLNISNTGISIASGYGASSAVSVAIGNSLAQTIGNGTYRTATSFSAGSNIADVETGDFDGDGDADLVTLVSGGGAGSLKILFNDGSGSFSTHQTATLSTTGSTDLELKDINGDSILDIIASGGTSANISVALGNSNGYFTAFSLIGNQTNDITIGDFNNDGKMDIVGGNASASGIYTYLGNGNGTFKSSMYFSATSGSAIASGDINLDGNLDLVTSGAYVKLGNGDGSFGANIIYSLSSATNKLELGDVNRDGYLDIISDQGNTVFAVMLNNGDGTFQARQTFAAGITLGMISAVDADGDGNIDVLGSAQSGGVSLLRGNGDGTFRAAITSTIGGVPSSGADHAVADYNGDGSLDLATVAGGYSDVFVSFSNPTTTTRGDSVDLMSQAASRRALDALDSQLERVAAERGALGAYMSRLDSVSAVTSTTRSAFIDAKSQITDADVAFETARLTRSKILQQASTAVLAQANASPQIALTLLGFGGSNA